MSFFLEFLRAAGRLDARSKNRIEVFGLLATPRPFPSKIKSSNHLTGAKTMNTTCGCDAQHSILWHAPDNSRPVECVVPECCISERPAFSRVLALRDIVCEKPRARSQHRAVSWVHCHHLKSRFPSCALLLLTNIHTSLPALQCLMHRSPRKLQV